MRWFRKTENRNVITRVKPGASPINRESHCNKHLSRITEYFYLLLRLVTELSASIMVSERWVSKLNHFDLSFSLF